MYIDRKEVKLYDLKALYVFMHQSAVTINGNTLGEYQGWLKFSNISFSKIEFTPILILDILYT
jgi:hypothetical protein